MSLRFPYKLISTGHPVVPLGGRFVRPRPILAVTRMGPTSSRAQDPLLDCGADDTVFPEDLATLVGIDLRNAPEGQAIGVGPSRARVKYAEATLRITDGHELREWRAWVGF